MFRLPRRLRITFEGKAFLLITLGVGAAAINTGNNLLYLAFSMNLSLIVVSGFLSEWTASAGFPCRAGRLRGVRGAGVVPGGHLLRGRETVPRRSPCRPGCGSRTEP